MVDDEKFLIVPLGKESRTITQTVSNETAMEIMELLADGPMSTSSVAERLGIPLTTAQYNIEKLMEAGLAKIARTKYSEKGREVKLYEAMSRAIVILPGKSGAAAVIDALKRYIVVLPVVAAVAIAVEYLMPSAPADDAMKAGGAYLTNAMPSQAPTPAALPVAASPEAQETARYALDQAAQGVAPLVQHAGLWLFAGCLLAMLLLVVLEYVKYNKTPKR